MAIGQERRCENTERFKITSSHKYFTESPHDRVFRTHRISRQSARSDASRIRHEDLRKSLQHKQVRERSIACDAVRSSLQCAKASFHNRGCPGKWWIPKAFSLTNARTRVARFARQSGLTRR